MAEVDFPGTVTSGSSGSAVRKVQEWLSLHGFQVAVDGAFGPATKKAVQLFQGHAGLAASGTVTSATWDALVAPLSRAMNATATSSSFGRKVVAIAKQHLKEHPREVGGQNMGPWVRFYMKGKEGADWPWCAGFVSTVLAQAAAGSPPIKYTVSCDTLAALGKAKELFLPSTKANKSTVLPGSVFLSRRTSTDWTHTGLVVSADDNTFATIEGNTNDSGDREGFEVCARVRGYASKDFVVFG